ncbi:5128_t:CDS:2 [Entrophospora sp. SA101]|nr:5128_t:CDS:2 [Entrophospora sp. SA101]
MIYNQFQNIQKVSKIQIIYNASSIKKFYYSKGSFRVQQHLNKLLKSKLTIVNVHHPPPSSSFKEEDKCNIDSNSSKPFVKFEQKSINNFKNYSFHNLSLKAKQYSISVFMPKGYPDSVTKNYWGFVKWQFYHNVAGSVTVLSTQSLLYAMGLGAKSIPLAAALNWIIKDGLGQLGGVIYAAVISDRFDSEPKRHRFQATVAMQLSSLLELLAPLWPGMFLIIASISNIGKNISWLASSATRAQMHKTFALRENLGDITGKSGSQTTAAGLLGTALGVVISVIITKYYYPAMIALDATANSLITSIQPIIPIFIAFIPSSIFNIYGSYRSSLYVTTSTLNIPQISHKETFVRKYKSPFNIPLLIEPALHHYSSEKYSFNIFLALKQKGFIHSEEYFIMRLYHACVLRYYLENESLGLKNSSDDKDYNNQFLKLINETHTFVENSFDQLKDELVSKEWDIECLFLTDNENGKLIVER